MLVVGEAAIQMDKKNIPDITEILVSNDKVEDLKRILGLKNASGYAVSFLSTLYHRKSDGRKYLINKVGNNIYLMKFLVNSLAISDIKIATPAINYAYMWTIPNLRHKDPQIWFRKAKMISKLRNDFLSTYKGLLSQTRHLLNGKNIAGYFSNMGNIVKTSFPYGEFEFIDKYEIMRSITKQDSIPCYQRFTVQGRVHIYLENIFSRTFTESQRFNAVIDKIYIDTINEYFISDMWIYQRFPISTKWANLFLTSIMNICTNSDVDEYFIKQYVFQNLDAIIASYDSKPFMNFISDYHRGAFSTSIGELCDC